MKDQGYVPRIVLAVVALLLLGGLGAYWPRWAGAAAAQSSLAPEAIIRDAISYQGRLTDDKSRPLTDTFTMRFRIFNAKEGGALLWDSGATQVVVNDGLFRVRLGVTTDIFNGEALWLAQTVNGELLTPRQEILPAPMAHTLRPGAIIKGTASAIPNNYLLDVQMNNDAFAFNRGAIFGQSTTGNAIYGLADNGRAIYGQTQDGYAVYGFDGGSDANRGYAGYFYSTNGIGVYGYSNGDRTHPNILAPGVYGQSNQGVGVYGRGDTSNSYSFYNEGGYFEGGKGLYARGTDPVWPTRLWRTHLQQPISWHVCTRREQLMTPILGAAGWDQYKEHHGSFGKQPSAGRQFGQHGHRAGRSGSDGWRERITRKWADDAGSSESRCE